MAEARFFQILAPNQLLFPRNQALHLAGSKTKEFVPLIEGFLKYFKFS